MNNLLLDFEQAKSKHLLFKSRLRSILYDISVDESPVLSHHECAVGQWIYNHALKAYGHIPEMQTLEKVHADIHSSAKRLVELHKAGKTQEAKDGLSEMEAIADNLVDLLTTIEQKIDANPLDTSATSHVDIKLDEYYDLLRSNAELNKRIKQQIAESGQSALKFDTVLSALQEGITIRDAHGTLQTANKSAENLIGLSFEQMQGLSAIDSRWGTVYEDGSPMPGEEHPPMLVLKTKLPQLNRIMGIRRPDGSIIWLQVNAQPLIDVKTGELSGVVSSFFDVTATKRATADLKESEHRFRLLAEATPQMIFTANSSGQAGYFNPQWFHFTGLNHEALMNTGWQNVIHPDDLHYTLNKYNSFRRSENGGEFESRFKGSDGIYRWHLNRMLPIQNEDVAEMLWIITTTDINDLKQLQEQKDDFISIASHELKTPVTTLKASLQLLSKIKDNPSSKMLPTLIEQANKSLEKVSVLIEDLLNASKFNQGQLHLKKSNFNLSKLVEDCSYYVRTADEYQFAITGDKDIEVYADADRIDQVLTNFVNNAIKYAPESLKIIINIEKLKDHVKVSVIDKGRGIPKNKLLHLFERYYRVDAAGAQYSGLGLGLYICCEIVKKHNGEIGADSTIGEGSTFWFTLPLT
ncbi:MAG TPA: ATP-binding protein [Sphingobacteriaceae bacterium]|nr:ATP-binding protein [Sphingobacteriaceae bacterium]